MYLIFFRTCKTRGPKWSFPSHRKQSYELTRHFYRQIPRNCGREAWDALTGLLEEDLPTVQDPQLRVNKNSQRLNGETAELSCCRGTVFKHLLWIFQGQDTEGHPNLRCTQSHALELPHHFHHTVDDLLDLWACHSCRVNGSCMWTKDGVSYLAHMVVRRSGTGYDPAFHILKIGAHLNLAGQRASIGQHMWKTSRRGCF